MDAQFSSDMQSMLVGWGRTTATFYFYIPIYPHVLNTMTCEFCDLAPDYPRLFAIIEHWESLEGSLNSVTFVHSKLPNLREWRNVVAELDIPPSTHQGLIVP